MSAWVRRLTGTTAEQARATLVCFPPGGGGSGAFTDWRARVPAYTAVYAVDPPGRGARIGEAAVESVSTYLATVAAEVRALSARRLVLVGVSLGGMLAFECCRHVPADHLVVIAAVPPDHYDGAARDRSTGSVRDLVVAWGLTDPEVLEFDEFADVVLPPIASDLRLGDSYDGRAAAPVAVPVLAVAGADDGIAPPDTVRGWKAFTTGEIRMSTVPGGHFVHDDVLPAVLSEVL